MAANRDPNSSLLPGSSAQTTARSSRQSSISIQHQPGVPSGLRHAQMPPSSPEDHHHAQTNGDHLDFEADGIHPVARDGASVKSDEAATHAQGAIEEPQDAPDVKSKLLAFGKKYHLPGCGDPDCDHGQYSPRPRYHRDYARSYGSIASSERSSRLEDGHRPDGDGTADEGEGSHTVRQYIEGALGESATDGLLGHLSRKSTTHSLAKRQGARHERLMYLLYYLPITRWLPHYTLAHARGDLIAALTMSSFYIPMALSYAANLAHIPPINGLYSFAFQPVIYALLGTCPQMVVGPEAAGSLLTGGAVKAAIDAGHHHDHDGSRSAAIAGLITSLAGSIILAAGICRLGFLDSVLSRPFLRGFISAIGIVILVDQLVPEMGLDTAASHSEASHGSSLDKILFLFRHVGDAHKLTCILGFSTIAIVLTMRELKKRLQPRMAWVAYIPDRFLVVVLSAIFTWRFGWETQGLQILGDIRGKGIPFQPEFPFGKKNFEGVDDAFGTAFVIALLGFFESSVAGKSLGSGGPAPRSKRAGKGDDGPQGGDEVEEADTGVKSMAVSANRELVALGVGNLIGGCFMSLPAFGGYGRSKVNASTGGTTPMSSVFLSAITVICVLFLLPYFYYIPKATLSAMISVVAYSLIEEAPADILFFWRISGYSELLLMLLIFLTTFLWNLRVGISVGIGLSLLRVLRHSTRPRIQILGRVPNTLPVEFEDAERVGTEGERVEFVPHCLIVKIPEPLTFANTGSLKDRLRRLEDHGSAGAHPGMPKVRRAEPNKNLIFDVHGVTSLDPAAAQVLLEIVEGYIQRGTRVFFCRVPGKTTEVWRLLNVTGILELVGGESHFLRGVSEALRAAESSSGDEEAEVGGDDGGMGDEVEGIRERMRRSQREDGDGRVFGGGDGAGNGNGSRAGQAEHTERDPLMGSGR
ncbi:hypothetical protein LTR35_010295 [Friedmanniomyces endolithicus]|uniref:STAS domain-containing protein n=1 Tax=Friedmanniomyces endolithicus TaxID=329885 RepID=A0AAN6FAF4_9PEZI|nr:hypothetical protein LTR35_010295 [Friedmanniomyces endolithicus]KAK0284006.1 hypothetical protein LTS00_011447 [Friedmanniomyces endolithicus]KAK0308727.1 hypothetical protein LTR82_015417 [Friedmanniomyces endolithicus]KAK0992049.1 hypothetical protein LTR54_011555 [Friedmanniomyces endolithicus]